MAGWASTRRKGVMGMALGSDESGVAPYVPLSIRMAGPEVVAAWHDPRPVLLELARYREVLEAIAAVPPGRVSGRHREAVRLAKEALA